MVIELAVLIGIAVGAAAAAIYWTKILQWARNSLLPWIDQHMPSLSDDVRTAFVNIDKVVVPIRAAVKAAWQRVRHILLDQIAEFEQLSSNTWLLRITSWVRAKLDELDPARQAATKIVTTQNIAFDELPPEVREQLLRKGDQAYKIHVTNVQDNQLDLAMST